MGIIEYEVTTYDTGNYDVKHRGKGDVIPYVSLTTFYHIWKRDYAHINMSRPIKDICVECFRFANRHKYTANHGHNSPASLQLDSSADDSLFQPPAEDAKKSEPESTGFEPEAIDDVEPSNMTTEKSPAAAELQRSPQLQQPQQSPTHPMRCQIQMSPAQLRRSRRL